MVGIGGETEQPALAARRNVGDVEHAGAAAVRGIEAIDVASLLDDIDIGAAGDRRDIERLAEPGADADNR